MIELREGFQIERDGYYDKVNYVDAIQLYGFIAWTIFSVLVIWWLVKSSEKSG